MALGWLRSRTGCDPELNPSLALGLGTVGRGAVAPVLGKPITLEEVFCVTFRHDDFDAGS